MSTNQLGIQKVMERTMSDPYFKGEKQMFPCIICGSHFDIADGNSLYTPIYAGTFRKETGAKIGMCPKCLVDLEDQMIGKRAPAELQVLVQKATQRMVDIVTPQMMTGPR